MLRGNQSIAQYSRSNMTIWMALAFQGGAINVGAFLSCRHFVSHVTGFASTFGIELVRFDYTRALEMLVVPLFFLLGSFMSGLLIDLPIKLKERPKYFVTFGFIFAVLVGVLIGGNIGVF